MFDLLARRGKVYIITQVIVIFVLEKERKEVRNKTIELDTLLWDRWIK